MINNFHIVVARYNENISWLHKFKNITTIYNKGAYDKYLNDFNVIGLPNFGRESHTFLYHIINNYDNLNEYTIFIQGSLGFDKGIKHSPLNIENYFQLNDFNAKLQKYDFNLLKYPINHIGKWKKEYNTGVMKKSFLTCYSWLKNFLDFDDSKVDEINIAWGAIFSIHKSIILKKPKIFYEHLIRFVDYHPNPEEGHFFERSWHFIFFNKHIDKKVINIFKYNKSLDINKIKTESHIWIDTNYYNTHFHKIDNFVLFPNYYFKINKSSFNFTFTDLLYIKIKINEDNFFQIILSNKQDLNFLFLNNELIEKFKNNLNNSLNNLNNSLNNFNFSIDSNIFKIYINNEIQISYDLKNIKIQDIDDINVFLKTNNYNNNITFNNYNEKLKYIMEINNYYDIKSFYKNNYLNNFICYKNFI